MSEEFRVEAVGGKRYGSLAEAWAVAVPVLAEMVVREVLRRREREDEHRDHEGFGYGRAGMPAVQEALVCEAVIDG